MSLQSPTSFGGVIYKVYFSVFTSCLEALELRNVLGALRRIAFGVTFASGGQLGRLSLRLEN